MRTYGTLAYGPPRPRETRGWWLLKAEPHVMVRVRRIFGRVQSTRSGGVMFTDTPEVARDLQWLMERFPLNMGDATRQQLQGQGELFRSREEAIARILGGGRIEDLREPARAAREYQRIAADLAITTGRLLCTDDLGLGKAQPLDSPVLTPTGYRRMGDLAVGDPVIAGDGTPTAITRITPQGEIDCYEVTFSDGSAVECSEDHLWRVRRAWRSRSKRTGEMSPWYWQTLTCRELLDRGITAAPTVGRSGQAKWHIPMVQAPELEGGQPRPLDPYLLGVLLGDGGFTGNALVLTSADDELVQHAQAVAPPGVMLRRRQRKYRFDVVYEGQPTICATTDRTCDRPARARGLCRACYQRAVARQRRDGTSLPPTLARSGPGGRNPVIAALVDLGLWGHGSLSKSVPTAYRLAPAADRLAVLQGLMDTDGYALPLKAGGATAQFYSSSLQLTEDARWLAESLGGTGRITSKEAAGRPRYTVTIKLPSPLNPFRLSRKASTWGDGHQTLKPTRAIVSIRRVGRKPMQCIAVDHPDRLYVTDRFAVTHNSMVGVLVLRAPAALPALVVCPTHLPKQWEREIAVTLPWLSTHVVTKGTPYDPMSRRGVNTPPDVLIMSYSKLRGWRDHLTGTMKTVIFDEAQELRHNGTEKWSAAASIADGAGYRVGLTNTPVYNYGGEIHNLFQVLAPDALGTREEFLREWGSGDPYDDKGKVKDPAALGSYLREQGLMLGRTRTEVGRELPPVLRVPQEIAADPKALDRIAGDAAEMARLILASDTDRQVKFRLAGELDWKVREATGIAKAPYVAEFVRLLLESEKKVLLLGWHRAVYDIWLHRLREFQPVLYTGSESPQQKARHAESFINGDARVLVMSLRAAAGLDGLQEASRVAVFGELDWSPQVHEQAIGRLNRDGQTDPVLAYFLHTDSGSDPPIVETLQIKRGQSEPMMSKDGKLFRQTVDNGDRIRRLAESVLAGRGRREPIPEPVTPAVPATAPMDAGGPLQLAVDLGGAR